MDNKDTKKQSIISEEKRRDSRLQKLILLESPDKNSKLTVLINIEGKCQVRKYLHETGNINLKIKIVKCLKDSIEWCWSDLWMGMHKGANPRGNY